MIAFIYRLANWTALVGGIVLVALTLMVVASVAGRAMIGLGLGPVPGDFELVEIGVGVAVFMFLPWCYLRGGHATVDLLYMHMPSWGQKAINIVSDVLMLLVWLVLTWKLWDGLLKRRNTLRRPSFCKCPSGGLMPFASWER